MSPASVARAPGARMHTLCAGATCSRDFFWAKVAFFFSIFPRPVFEKYTSDSLTYIYIYLSTLRVSSRRSVPPLAVPIRRCTWRIIASIAHLDRATAGVKSTPPHDLLQVSYVYVRHDSIGISGRSPSAVRSLSVKRMLPPGRSASAHYSWLAGAAAASSPSAASPCPEPSESTGTADGLGLAAGIQGGGGPGIEASIEPG